MILADRHIVKKKDKFGWTGLMKAAKSNNSHIVNLIISTPGVIISERKNKSETAIHCACENNSIETVKLILQHPHCSQEFIYMTTNRLETARMIAERMGHTECEKLLEDYAAAHSSGNSNTGRMKNRFN